MKNKEHPPATVPAIPQGAVPSDASARRYLLERVGEAAVVQVYADGFASQPIREKLLMWHLSQAALAGRDIYYDQRYARNLEMRDLLEAVVTHPDAVTGDARDVILRYTKLFWINTGPYNTLTSRKFVLECEPAAFAEAVRSAAAAGARLPLRPGESPDALVRRLAPLFFDRTSTALSHYT